MSTQITYSVAIIIAYLVGSISSAILISRAMRLPDPRGLGSGNPGATNVLRTGNKKAAAMTLVGDLLKGLLPVLVGHWLQLDLDILCLIGLAAIFGHMYPIFYQFHGGKGVATTLGVLLGISWPLALIWTALIATLLMPVSAWLMDFPQVVVLLMISICVLIFWRHRNNIRNLLRGNESRIGSDS